MNTVQDVLADEVQNQIDRLREAHKTLENASKVLADHNAARGACERQALAELMQSVNPATNKTWSGTAGMENLDLIPEFAQWRHQRNVLEHASYVALHRVEEQKRVVDYALLLLKGAMP